METQAAIIIAQVLGPLYVVAGLGLIATPERAARLIAEMEASPGQTFTWGFIALALGLLVLAFHSSWTASWQVIVTLIGWLATVKGVLLLLAPELLMGLTHRLFPAPARLRAWAAGPIVLGAFLTAMSYGLA